MACTTSSCWTVRGPAATPTRRTSPSPPAAPWSSPAPAIRASMRLPAPCRRSGKAACACWARSSTCSDQTWDMIQVADQRLTLPAIALVGAVLGVALVAGEVTSFLLLASLIGWAVILVDFRIGVVLLV